MSNVAGAQTEIHASAVAVALLLLLFLYAALLFQMRKRLRSTS